MNTPNIHLVHPGERTPPVCEHLEYFFIDALKKKQTKDRLANLVIGQVDEERHKLSATIDQVKLTEKLISIRNGLIMEGEFLGFWANWIYEDVWLLARANTDPRIIPNSEVSKRSCGHADLELWKGIRRAIHSGESPTSIGRFTLDLKDIQKSLATLNQAR